MPIPSQFPNVTDTNATNLLDVAKYNGTVTQGLFMPVILLVIWVIAFTGLSYVDKSKAFITATFVTWTISILLWAAGALDQWLMILFTVIFLGNLMYLIYSNVKGTG